MPDSNEEPSNAETAAAPAEAGTAAPEEPTSPSNAIGEALVAHAQEVQAGSTESAPAEDPVSPSNAAGEALAAHAKEVAAAPTAAEDPPVSPSNAAAEALVAHAQEVGPGAETAAASNEDPVSPSNAAAEALAAHAKEVEGAATAEPSPPAEDPVSPSNAAAEALAAHAKEVESAEASNAGTAQASSIEAPAAPAAPADPAPVPPSGEAEETPQASPAMDAVNSAMNDMKEVDTSLSDEEIVAKALSEHLKQISEVDAIDKALADHAREVAENDQVVAQALAEQAKDEEKQPKEEKPPGRDLQTSNSLDSFQSQSPKTMNRSVRSSPGFSSHSDDLKSRLQFASMTEGGVKKGPTYMHIVSKHEGGARWSFGQKGQSTFFASTDSPPPGAYNLPSGPGAASGGKYKKPPNFSFGGSSRFALGPSEKKQPGPGAYNPKDPLMTAGPKVSFTGGNSGRGLPLPENAPGPGAYEQRSSLGKSKMFTARGRALNSSARSRSQPGPGAYNPKVNAVLMGIPRCGFGTATRQDITGGGSSLFGPGPGAYDLQNAMSLGKNGPKYSATSRRRVHDLDSYVTPGPGTYNAHTTSFVY